MNSSTLFLPLPVFMFTFVCGCTVVADQTPTPDASPDVSSDVGDLPDAQVADSPADVSVDASPPHALVPLTIAYQTAQQVAFTVPITVGSTTTTTVLDTGSAGLRILPGVLAQGDIVTTTLTQVTETYANGVQLIGHVAFANVALGGWGTPGPIPVMMIDTVQCQSGHPSCPAAGYTAADYQMKPDGSGHGYRSIMGTGMHSFTGSAQVGDPIVQLAGHPSWVVRIPNGYGATSGTIEIGPPQSALVGLTTVQLPPMTNGAPLADGSPAWDDWAIPTCVDDLTTKASWCSPSLFDTGAGPTIVDLQILMSATNLATGDSVKITVTDLGSYAFTVGAPAKPGLDEVTLVTGNGPTNIGTAIFFRKNVYFDHTKGMVGLLP